MNNNKQLAKGKHLFIYSITYNNNDKQHYQNALGMADGLTNYIRYIDNREVVIKSSIFNNFFKSGRLPKELARYINKIEKETLQDRYKDKADAFIKDKEDNIGNARTIKTEYSASYLKKERVRFLNRCLKEELGITA